MLRLELLLRYTSFWLKWLVVNIACATLFSAGSSLLELNRFRAPEPLPILNASNVVPKNGFPVVKGLRHLSQKTHATIGVIKVYLFLAEMACC